MGTIGGEELLKWEKMQTRASNLEEKILVLVRLRPLSEREIARDEVVDWECINGNTILYRNSLRERSGFPTAYTYDRVFGGDCSTRQLYDEGAKEIALSVVSGINSTIFAYGQTSSGKTYTMIGLTENTVADIYAYMHRHEERAFVLKFSAMEIYNEVVRDLLSNDSSPLRILDDQEKGTIVEKLTEEKLRDWNHLKQLLSICEAQRQTGETSLNEKSSRSHQILRLTIESSACEFLGKDKSTTLSACVNFVDLAGSERASQALSVGARLKEGCHINRSLLTLGTVIRKLSNGKHGHINYRDSKLTRILQPSLGGNARTAIVCTLCPARSHVEQSRNTLLFASCAKEVTTNAQVNVVMSDKALVKHLQKEVARLESELRSPAPTTSTCDYGTLLRKKDLQIERMEKEIRELTKQRDLAQSRVQDLLQVIENDQASRQWVGGEDESTSPGVANSNFLDVNTQKFCKFHYYDNGHGDPYQDHPDSSDDCSVSDDMSPYQNGHMEEITIGNREDPDDLCKDVQCVEMEQSSKDQNFESPALTSGENEGLAVAASRNVGITDWRVISTPLSRDRDISSCNGSTKLTRSWSCGDNGRVQFCDSERGVPGTLEDMQRRSPLSMYGINAGRLLGNESQAHIRKSFVDKLKELDIENSTYDDITSIHTFVAGLKEMAELQFGKQRSDDQVQEAGASVVGSGTSPKGVGLDWPLEFERLRWAIIELWQTCNVSLVHRTYFFLLFSGEPSDSIYMEVELRRLSFLKEQFFQGNHAVRDGRTQTLKFSSSVKTLCRERHTLCKLMRKRFSKREREKLYKEWGVNLESRRRHLRLTNRLWSDTKDLDHITKSARIVARLVKFSEKEKDLKEMFGLSFTPPPPARKSLVGGLLHGLSSSPRKGGI